MSQEATRSAVDEPVLSMEDVRVRFEESGFLGLTGKDSVDAVDGVSLDIGENDVVALVGESGCGKTTLGKTAIGLQQPTGGSVRYRGQDIWEARDRDRLLSLSRRGDDGIPFADIRKSLQIIHQDPESSMNANYTVENELEQPLKKWQSDLSRADRRARIRGLLEYVGMKPAEDYADRYPHQLSGGEQQRVALIRSLLMNPDVILADEAISALDVSLRVEVMELMLDLQEQFNTSYLFISHDLANAWYLAKKAGGRIGIMYLGELVEIGPVDEIVHDPQHPYTKALLWATPDLMSSSVDDPPIRKIDVPDPSDPPSGCRFHTRCPEAREVCRSEKPDTFDIGPGHEASCFRVLDNHEYWNSAAVEDDDSAGPGMSTSDD
jgi:peptide/nickel transport system ATP-binding protein